MKYRTTRITGFFDKPGGTQLFQLFPNEVVDATGQTNGALIEVVLKVGDRGWISSTDCKPDSGSRLPVDREIFVDTCIDIETAMNGLDTTAPWYVAADFVIARGLIETNLINVAPAIGSTAVGPLKVTQAEWDASLAFLQNDGKTLGAGPFQEGDFDHWLKQIWGAIYRMYADAKAISAKQTAAAGLTDKFVPSYLDLFHAYLASVDAAVAILDASGDDQDQTKTVLAVLQPMMAQADLDALFATRSQYTGTLTSPKTIKDFVAATGAALDDALKNAFDLIKQFAPEELLQIKQGEAPWFDVALKAEADHIAEATNASDIESYFDATDLGHQNHILPWCGAFAAHCMKDSGNATAAASIPKGAAAAVNWSSWGTALPVRADAVPQGAVVVLSKTPGTDGTGHVAFCVQFLDDGKSIQLLGGNQSHRVQRSTFPASKIHAIRWLDLEGDNVRSAGDTQPSQTKISQAAFDLIVACEVSSQAVYEKKLTHPEWPGEQSGVTIGIGYDVGYATQNQLRSDWAGNIPGPMIDALVPAIGKTGPAARPLASQLGAVVTVPWDAAIQVHKNAVIPRWVAIVQNALPNTNLIGPDCLGALVSLTYNRGASFNRPEPRYSEMRDIKQHMESKQFQLIPDDFRHMERLWPNSAGLRDRREQEAKLFERGLASLPTS
ncbi:MAG TPA: CHAP domain-containing protein [Xanthobacteraceae bacterium]|nr:CHAP domain-containing protein [Xanthobacteraceae bacterium]